MKKMNLYLLALAAVVSISACGSKKEQSSLELQGEAATEASASGEAAFNSDAAKKIVAFDADSAYAFVADQVACGPRIPGTEGHRRCVDYIANRLRSAGAEVEISDRDFTTVGGEVRNVKNISGVFNPGGTQRVMLMAHYDTRPWADQDPDAANHQTPIDGANDGASGVAVLLEIARNIAHVDPSIRLELMFFDDEDAGSYSNDESWCIGSQAWASSLGPNEPRPDFAILLDMVGGRDARFHREMFSEVNCKVINDLVWNAAARAGHADRFVNEYGGAINDDHISALKIGIPAIDIIESQNAVTGNFPPTWHTLADNLDNIDRESLRAVGETLMTLLAPQ